MSSFFTIRVAIRVIVHINYESDRKRVTLWPCNDILLQTVTSVIAGRITDTPADVSASI